MFKWTFRVIRTLQMKTKTKELILLLLDFLMTRSQFESVRLELLSISVVYYLMQIEGDMPDSILEFNLFVEKKLQIAKADIFNIEMKILVELPTGFFTMFTFSDIISMIVSDDQLSWSNSKKIGQRAIRLALNYYILLSSGFTIQDLSLAAVSVTLGDLDVENSKEMIQKLFELNIFTTLGANAIEVRRLIEALENSPRGGLGFSHTEPDFSDDD